MFTTFDADNDGILSSGDLARGVTFIDTDETRQLLRFAELDETILQSAAELCYSYGDEISKQNFSLALISLTEPPRASDIRELRQFVDQIEEKTAANMACMFRLQDLILTHLKISVPHELQIEQLVQNTVAPASPVPKKQ